ncbi:unnamed protein product [Adineta steineri]|uniref:BZIP domain-containing protein n=1 Tax=Adineta steineri TaxID=433720 RepID=A0A815D8N0_9BILA|nr:unnamed protein product [Adineta steineri]CAF1293716.1 unnamed protein product [Adineta steineri]
MQHNQQMIKTTKNSIRIHSTLNVEILQAHRSPLNTSMPTEINDSIDLSHDQFLFDSNIFQEDGVILTEDDYNDLSIDLDNIDPTDYLFNSDSNMSNMQSSSPQIQYDEMTEVSTDSGSNELEQDQRDSAVPSDSTPKLTRFGSKKVIKYSAEYYDRRSKNNGAVHKSREKAKENKKARELKMAMLANENQQLINRVDLLTKELESLKSSCEAFNQILPTNAVE